MAISSEKKCSICRFSCKSDVYKTFCKFIPKEEHLGQAVHFKDPNNSKHEETSRMCVVCKEWLNYRKIHWKKESDGWYSMCKDCAKEALFISESVLKSEVDINMASRPHSGAVSKRASKGLRDWHAVVYGGAR